MIVLIIQIEALIFVFKVGEGVRDSQAAAVGLLAPVINASATRAAPKHRKTRASSAPNGHFRCAVCASI